jgi:hypothetical protein
MKKRLSLYITDEISADIDDLCKKTGLTRGTIGALALSSGLQSIKISLDPKWKNYIEEMIRTGKPIKMGDYMIGSEDDLATN